MYSFVFQQIDQAFPFCYDSATSTPSTLELGLLPFLIIVGTDKGGLCVYYLYPKPDLFKGAVFLGYPVIGSTVINLVMGISWTNMGDFSGLISIADSRTRIADYNFNPPPITTIDID